MLLHVHQSWSRCFKKISGQPRLKGRRNRLNSIPFPDPINTPKDGRILMPFIGKVRFHKQNLPIARIKCGRIVKRASGWYLCLCFDCVPTLSVQDTNLSTGIDPGFSTLIALSDGHKVDNPKELQEGALRLAQAQRAKNKPLAARLQERQLNRRRDRNHKISRRLVENYATICYSEDNFSGMAKRFGKSVSQAALGQLIRMLDYKCRIGGRTLIPVNSQFTTMTCSSCGARNGPTGLAGLAVRHWECACGAQHDRDINAAINILNAGLGRSLKGTSNGPNRQEASPRRASQPLPKPRVYSTFRLIGLPTRTRPLISA